MGISSFGERGKIVSKKNEKTPDTPKNKEPPDGSSQEFDAEDPDYCVRRTVEDGLKAGFEVVVLEDAVRAVNIRPGDGEAAFDAMTDLGARRSTTAEIEKA